jgi:ABC-type cobalamin/Fe3+-siderophores transport system ATPase subunit
MYSIILKNIRGIKDLTFPFPEKKGVYVLTGTNGCGKTSLMIALNRLGYNFAFSAFPISPNGRRIDTFKQASISYATPTDKVTYRRREIRWVPMPRSKSGLLSQFPYKQTLFIATSSNRFFSQLSQINLRQQIFNAAQETKDAMNSILDTTRFSSLQYYTVNPIRGRKKSYYRSDKLYIIKQGTTTYSENNFSLGERLLLNTLDALENIPSHTLLLIDEIELALHPIAQVRLYNYLEKKAKEKDLAVIISTHSSTLIRHAKNRYFLEKDNNGIVNVIKDCFPAYILKQIGSREERHCDLYFFVEDDMAEKYLRSVLHRFWIENNLHNIYTVEPIGGYDSVIRFVQNINSMGIPKAKAQAFLDADAKDVYQALLDKGNERVEGDNKKLALFNDNRENITYLSITPELGIWTWIVHNRDAFRTYFEEKHGHTIYNIAEFVDETSNAEAHNLAQATTDGQHRKWAKGCFKNFTERVYSQDHSITEQDVIKDMIDCYVQNTYDNEFFKPIISPLLNRR